LVALRYGHVEDAKPSLSPGTPCPDQAGRWGECECQRFFRNVRTEVTATLKGGFGTGQEANILAQCV
jgi:hypothetical protein